MSNTQDTFLTSSEGREKAFLRDLSVLLNHYGVDNAVNTPDHRLAKHLHNYLTILRNSLREVAIVPICENCDGLGFIPPLTAIDAPTLQRWLDQSRQRCHLDQHPNGVAPALGRNVTDYGARPFIDNKSEYLDDAVRYGTGGTPYRPFSSDDVYDQGLREIVREKGGGPCSQ